MKSKVIHIVGLFLVFMMMMFVVDTVAKEFVDHPRLFLTPERIERIQTQHITTDSYDWQRTLACASRSDIDGAVAKAMLYRVNGDMVAAHAAVVTLQGYMDGPFPNIGFNNAGPFFNKWALCYDWLSGYAPFEAIKPAIRDWINRIEQNDWDYYTNAPYMNGHQKAIWGAPLWGMATAGEDTTSLRYLDSGDRRWDRTKYLFGFGPDYLATWKDGILPSGHDYGSGTVKNSLIYMEAAKTSYGATTWEDATYVQNYLTGFLHQYYYAPDYFHRSEHGHNAQKKNGYFATEALAALIVADHFPDSDESKMVQWWFNNAEGALRYPSKSYRYFSYWALIFRDLEREEIDPGLHLTNSYLVEWPGIYLYRSDYSAELPPTLFWTFRAGNQIWFNQNHYDNGNIFIAWKGSNLLIDAGIYDGGGGNNILNYSNQTIGHNSILVKDPLEECGWNPIDQERCDYYENSGGQRLGWRYTPDDSPIDGVVPDPIPNTFPKHLHDAADIVELEETDRYTYILSDITNSYANPRWEEIYSIRDLNKLRYRPKVDVVEREVLFVDNLFVVFDRIVATDPTFDKYITHHSIWEPILNEEDEALVTGDNGQLWISVLSPNNFTVEKIGGEGYEYYVNGTNWDPFPNSHNDLGGNWRLEYHLTDQLQEGIFLHVLQPGDLDSEKKEVIEVLSSPERFMVMVNNTMVGFSKNRESVTNAAYMSYGQEDHIVVDLIPNTSYSVYNNGNLIDTQTSTESGVIAFTSSKGGYWLVVESSKIQGRSPALATLLGIIGGWAYLGY